ncbi:MAG TPA: mycothiol system anti-sigma-R factor [Acidimicrobiales bacterium]|nr:mycothiol system anti-sigma-R factor [Acidimicrobiales bacterium]
MTTNPGSIGPRKSSASEVGPNWASSESPFETPITGGTTKVGEGACGQGGNDCQEAIQTLYHYLDGELTDDRRQLIKAHLDDCQHCFDAFDFEEDLRHLIASKCQERVPDALRAKVFDAILKESQTFSQTDVSRDDTA